MKVLRKILLVVLTCTIILTSIVGCSSTGKKMMELEDSEITVNMFMLLLSRMKGNLASTLGSQVLKDTFWDKVMDASTGKTYNDYYTALVLQSAKTYLASLYLFEELDLELPDSYIDDIDAELKELIDYDANGSKSEFNNILADYGANYNVLREAYIMEAKISYLNDHLFGSNGEKIADNLYEDYYQDTYVKFRHIFFYTTKVIYVQDTNGDDIYYTEDGKIAYDKENGKKKEVDGAIVKDTNGDIVFVTEDGKIAYDKKNGTPKPETDSSGNIVTEKLTTDELIALSDKTTLIMEQAKTGDYALFDALIDTYNEDEGMIEYPNGYYLTKTSNYSAPEVRDALFEMEEGEIRKISSDYGVHIVMKYELDEGGYADEQNSDFFRTSEGTYSFLSTLKTALLSDYIDKYIALIKIDEEAFKSVSMKTVGANYNY